MKIYHYTTIDNLALILKNKTIRFNRLDQMDDRCEHCFFSFGLNWSPYTYVSCWSTTDEENIPLWHMYAKGGVGVRIGIDSDCIDLDNVILSGLRLNNKRIHPSTKSNRQQASVEYRPFRIYGDASAMGCYRPIKYIKNTFVNAEVAIGPNRVSINKNLIESEFREYIGLYKDQKWSFQNEVRFILFAVPCNSKESGMSFDEFKSIIAEEKPNPFTYFDLPLKDTQLKNIEITLGPNVTESSFLIVKLLTKEFLPTASILCSSLNSDTWEYL